MNILKSKDGSTSVLIIMLMIVLMIFGLAILTTTLSNESLSDKKLNWLKDFYNLESKVALELAEIDKIIQETKESVIKDNSNLDKTTLLVSLLEENFDYIDIIENEYFYEFEVSEDEGEYLKYILLRIKIIIPDSKLSSDEYLNKHNYEIVKFFETQDLFDYEDTEFGNPFFPDSE